MCPVDDYAVSLRSDGEGCVWKPYEFLQLGIRINYKDCADPDSRFVLRQDGDWIMQHRPADNVIFGSDHFIQEFSKPEHQSIEAAIKEQVVANISISEWKQGSRNLRDQKSARAVCRAVVMKTRRGLSEDKIRLEIYPKNGAYYSRIKQDLKNSRGILVAVNMVLEKAVAILSIILPNRKRDLFVSNLDGMTMPYLMRIR